MKASKKETWRSEEIRKHINRFVFLLITLVPIQSYSRPAEPDLLLHESPLPDAYRALKKVEDYPSVLPRAELRKAVAKKPSPATSEAEIAKSNEQKERELRNLEREKNLADLQKTYEAFRKAEIINQTKTDITITEEPRLNLQNIPIPELKSLAGSKKLGERLVSPDSISDSAYASRLGPKRDPKEPMPLAGPAKQVPRAEFVQSKPVTIDRIQRLIPILSVTEDQPPKALQILDEEDLRMLAALLLDYNGDKCHVVVGLYEELSKLPRRKEETEARLGICLHKMGLFTESVPRLLQTINTSSKFRKLALETLVNDLPKEFELMVAESLSRLPSLGSIAAEAQSRVNFLLARNNFEKGNYAASERFALQVPEKAKDYHAAVFVLALSLFETKKIEGAVNTLEDLIKKVPSSNKNLRSLIHINLGRMYFQMNQFDRSIQNYVKIEKDHPLWIEALTEQGWAQILNEDYVGAIGNMYSIHSPYFKAVFKPETYVVRTIGYLNICQYGDAYRTLTNLEEVYRPWTERINRYRSSGRNPQAYYETIRKYLKSASSTEVDNLPYQVLREVARQRDFLNIQEEINHRVEEKEQYSFIQKLIDQDRAKIVAEYNRIKEGKKNIRLKRKSKETNVSTNADAKKATGEVTNKNNLDSATITEEDKVNMEVLQFRLALYNISRRVFISIRERGEKKIDQSLAEARVRAGSVIERRLAEASENLGRVLDNNEFLRYEVFAGSGENIRYQVAGGKPGETRVPASAKPTSKSLQWAFDGEYWEDEIGHYRSTLTNNCPDAGRKSPGTRAAKSEAQGS